ncbi:MAG: thiamine phosphate synthase [Kiloniellales bacterium]
MNPLPQPPLLVITDRRQTRISLPEVALEVFAAGGRWLLLREKDLTHETRTALLHEILALAKPYDAQVTISADLAAARTAHGLHLPRDGDVAKARSALGPEKLIGTSAHDLAEAQAAAAVGADYVTLSPIFASRSKPGYGPALGPEGLGEIARGLPIPVMALGGIEAGNAAACLAAGAAGVAVMGAVMAAADPGAAVAELLAALQAPHPSGQS